MAVAPGMTKRGCGLSEFIHVWNENSQQRQHAEHDKTDAGDVARGFDFLIQRWPQKNNEAADDGEDNQQIDVERDVNGDSPWKYVIGISGC